ncbi:MAG: SpoIID/LytB domain-containing protein [Peptococcaceae bacterium]|nr:SpoIID/LytB domain-containing protein [Peptococcaceae bacterium]
MKRKLILLVALIFLFFVTSCAGGPQRKPQIPQSLNRGDNKEPRIKVALHETGEIREMPFEEYIAGVVAGEMQPDFPVNALAAQAILARTFTLDFVANKKSKYGGAHISTDKTEAQAYNPEAINDRIRQAVRKTRGKVATHNGDYIKAWFHSHAGGKTATAKEGLNFKEKEPPYIKVVKSPDSPKAPAERASWTATFTKQEFANALKQLGQDPGNFDQVKITKKGPSGRATRISAGRAKVAGADLRTALGPDKLKSTLINNIRVTGNNITISGKGWGHGVGMSQWGAYQMAENGKSAEDILNYYFKNIDIVKLWN